MEDQGNLQIKDIARIPVYLSRYRTLNTEHWYLQLEAAKPRPLIPQSTKAVHFTALYYINLNVCASDFIRSPTRHINPLFWSALNTSFRMLSVCSVWWWPPRYLQPIGIAVTVIRSTRTMCILCNLLFQKCYTIKIKIFRHFYSVLYSYHNILCEIFVKIVCGCIYEHVSRTSVKLSLSLTGRIKRCQRTWIQSSRGDNAAIIQAEPSSHTKVFTPT